MADYLKTGSDFFRKGIGIPDGSDLDTYYTVGKYYCNSGGSAETLLNCPTKNNFTLLVMGRTSSNTASLAQIIIDLTGNFYVRGCGSNNDWRDWKKFINQESFDEAISELETKLDSHTHIISYTPAGSIANTSITPEGSVSSSFTGSSKKSGSPSATISVAKAAHTHTFTPAGNISTPIFTGTEATISANYTPAGTVSKPTFSGTATNTQATAANYQTAAASSGHTHTLIAAGTVSQPTFTGNAATLTANYTPAGNISTPTFTGTSAKSGNPSANTSVAKAEHTHTVVAAGTISAPSFMGTEATLTANYTPAGTISAPSFTGNSSTTNATPNNTTHRVNVASSGHTHSYTAAGNISTPTFNGTTVTSQGPSHNAYVSLAEHMHTVTSRGIINGSVSNRCLTISFVGNASITDIADQFDDSTPQYVAVASSLHTHKVTAEGTVSTPTFSGTTVSTQGPSANTSVANAAHTHAFTPAGTVNAPTFNGTQGSISITYTPAGTLTEPIFTGNTVTTAATPNNTTHRVTVATNKHTHNTTAKGTVSNPTFDGTEGTISISYTPAGTVSQPTFNGSSVTSNGPSGSVTVAMGNHIHSVTAKGNISQPTFNGTAATISANYTPAGSVSNPTFTGAQGTVAATPDNTTHRVNVATNTHTHNTTATGTVTSVFSGTAANHTHTFNGTTATLTAPAIGQ